jgi:hypothetical protein
VGPNQAGTVGPNGVDIPSDLLVIAEEFGNWQDASCRIDLLAGQGRPAGRHRGETHQHAELPPSPTPRWRPRRRSTQVTDTFVVHLAQQRPDEDLDFRAGCSPSSAPIPTSTQTSCSPPTCVSSSSAPGSAVRSPPRCCGSTASRASITGCRSSAFHALGVAFEPRGEPDEERRHLIASDGRGG